MTIRHQATPIERLESCVQGDFLQAPGLRVTIEQAQRLWGLDGESCKRVLAVLVERGFLIRDAAGRYARPVAKWPASFRMAKAQASSTKKLKHN